MKTFYDLIFEKNADDNEVIKSFNIDGNKIQFRRNQFKNIILYNSTEANSYCELRGTPSIGAAIKMKSKNVIEITARKYCSTCEGTGEMECEGCDGEGAVTCSTCEYEHECEDCDGEGTIPCHCDEEFDEQEIIFKDEIVLNQFELF